jgi:hypothetical protein
MAPFLVGALAAAVWLQRRRPQRPALTAPQEPAQIEPPPRSGRFEREPRHEPIDIVTVVDDLLDVGL